jgi:uncharacterized protein YndB with AHSA1/START domain
MNENSVITECDLPDAPEKVWKALTVRELLAAWLPDAVDCEILAAEPPRLLCYRWPGNERDRDAAGRKLDSMVTFELTGTDTGGTHLRVVHRAFTSTARVVVPLRGGRSEPVACAGSGSALAMLRWAA